jgi:hypothetical protein
MFFFDSPEELSRRVPEPSASSDIECRAKAGFLRIGITQKSGSVALSSAGNLPFWDNQTGPL